MKLKNIPLEELELMTYDEIAFLLLQESGKKMKLIDLFKNIYDLLDMSDVDYEDKIPDFFELLSTNRKFVMLADGFWDLQQKHRVEITIESDEDEVIVDDIDESIDESEEDELDYEESEDDEGVNDDDDDLADLVIIDSNDEEDETSI